MTDLEKFRKEKDELFAQREESPLTPEQKSSFSGLHYYPPKDQLIFKDLTLERAEEEIVAIKTSAGDTEPYKKLGRINFSIEGKELSLTVFESIEGGHLFLPFKDKTNDSDTYHDGRYVEIEIEAGKVPELDFNYAYNPYCAYNDKWRCPITPEGNTLDFEIKAGEKRFH